MFPCPARLLVCCAGLVAAAVAGATQGRKSGHWSSGSRLCVSRLCVSKAGTNGVAASHLIAAVTSTHARHVRKIKGGDSQRRQPATFPERGIRCDATLSVGLRHTPATEGLHLRQRVALHERNVGVHHLVDELLRSGGIRGMGGNGALQCRRPTPCAL